ncbi:unnamed protein product [Prunus armeniaca]
MVELYSDIKGASISTCHLGGNDSRGPRGLFRRTAQQQRFVDSSSSIVEEDGDFTASSRFRKRRDEKKKKKKKKKKKRCDEKEQERNKTKKERLASRGALLFRSHVAQSFRSDHMEQLFAWNGRASKETHQTRPVNSRPKFHHLNAPTQVTSSRYLARQRSFAFLCL